MKRIIPGHARAYTIWLFLLLVLVSYIHTKNLSAVPGIFLLICGAFFGDQATHLAQNDHAMEPPTWLEKCLQTYRYTSVIVGTILAVFGLYLLLA